MKISVLQSMIARNSHNIRSVEESLAFIKYAYKVLSTQDIEQSRLAYRKRVKSRKKEIKALVHIQRTLKKELALGYMIRNNTTEFDSRDYL